MTRACGVLRLLRPVKIFMPAGEKKPIYAPYMEHVPADPTSAMFWLKNRDPESGATCRTSIMSSEISVVAIWNNFGKTNRRI
jgi:hypothetical protein